MTDTDDDLRAAREWMEGWSSLEHVSSHHIKLRQEWARVILRRLDMPVCPRGEDVSADVIKAMRKTIFDGSEVDVFASDIRAAINTLHAHLTAPPKVPTVKDAALALNTAVDAMWNNRRSDSFVKAVCEAQQQLKRALEAADADE